MMKRSEYLSRALDLYDSGKISAEVYDAMIMNADEFSEPDGDERFPDSYAELEYDDFDSPEAIDGARFDDMNYLRHFER